eukprot:284815572_5
MQLASQTKITYVQPHITSRVTPNFHSHSKDCLFPYDIYKLVFFAMFHSVISSDASLGYDRHFVVIPPALDLLDQTDLPTGEGIYREGECRSMRYFVCLLPDWRGVLSLTQCQESSGRHSTSSSVFPRQAQRLDNRVYALRLLQGRLVWDRKVLWRHDVLLTDSCSWSVCMWKKCLLCALHTKHSPDKLVPRQQQEAQDRCGAGYHSHVEDHRHRLLDHRPHDSRRSCRPWRFLLLDRR